MTGYAQAYTWSHPYGDHCIAHSDGAVSCLIEWPGIDTATLDDAGRLQVYQQIYTLLHRLDEGYYHECHLWRERGDDGLILSHYRQATADAPRGGSVGRLLRTAYADHLERYAMTNTTALVITHPNRTGWIDTARRALLRQGRAAEELLAYARRLVSTIPGAALAYSGDYRQRIHQTYHRAKPGRCPDPDPRYTIADQIVSARPTLSGDTTLLDGVYTRTIYVRLYPDAQPGWITEIASLPVEMHISAILRPVDTRAALKSTERESDIAEGTAGRRGRSYTGRKLSHLTAFREYVVDHGLVVYANAYIVQLHHDDPAALETHARQVAEWVELAGGQICGQDYIQFPWLRYAQPGQGYRCPSLRPDHTWQVGNMLPVQTAAGGASHAADTMRLRRDGSLAGFDFTRAPIVHYLTSAMTRAGKGVDAVTTIAELYPLGIDYYIIEVGQCYRWLVEAYGGTYTVADPDTTAVNPLPAWRYATGGQDAPLPTEVVGSTATALAYLVTGGQTLLLSDHQRAALEPAIQALYIDRPDGAGDDSAPLLPELLESLGLLVGLGEEALTSPQLSAAREMVDNLDSFLATAAGKVFAKPDTLTLSDGITGVDLGGIEKANPALLRFYLIFTSLRMLHKAMDNYNRAYVWLDEMHYFVKHQPEIVGQLCSELVRMGGKKNAFLGIVTQELSELEAVEAAVINNMPVRNLLYRAGSHEEVIERLRVPPGAAALYKSWPNPIGQPWRPGLRTMDNDRYHDLYMTFPPPLLALAESSPQALKLKEQIGAETADPHERLNRLMEAMT